MNFKSEYAENADDLLQLKNDAFKGVEDRKNRLKIIRRFTNMMNTLSEEEAEELGRTEITNHGMTYRSMLQNETQFTSMVTVTNGLVEVVVDTDNAEQDLVTGMRISEAINRGAIHFKGRFANFWRKVAGEIIIAGGGAVTQSECYGWLPSLRPDMFFPKETSLDAEDVTYAFDPKELTVADLKRLQAAGKTSVEKENLDKLLEIIREQIHRKVSSSNSHSEETSKSVREFENVEKNTTLRAWWFYEVKYDKRGDQYVSATLFVDGTLGTEIEDLLQSKDRDAKDSVAKIIVYVDKAFKDASEWLHLVTVDSEIGGVKNLDTLCGIAERSYLSGVDMEELLNLIIEGEKIRSRPKVKLTDRANKDEVARWNIMEDTFAPEGVEELQFRGNSNGLQSPLAILTQNAASIGTAPMSNGPSGGELRQQAVERQQGSSMLQTNRVSEAYNHLDAILETIVWRILTGAVKPGAEGYREIMWIRSYLDRYNIPYKQLAQKKHGRFEFIRVRAHRTIGNGDRVQQEGTADWLMANLQNYEPVSRPSVVHKATVLKTQDPDLADFLVKPPKAIINAQKITAENEYDTIRRRAALGQLIPVAQDDIHQDHIPVHLQDMAAHVATHGTRPWDKLDVLIFAGAVEHTGEHLKILLTNPLTYEEGKRFIEDYQRITQSAQGIVQQIEQASGDEQTQLTPKEQADLQLRWVQLELRGRELGLRTEDMQRLWSTREARAALSRRQQLTREINEDRRLDLDNKRIDTQAQNRKSEGSSTEQETETSL